jgi:AraC-like DNA-binding protein
MVAASRIFEFTDPHPYQVAVRASHIELFPTTKGDFRAGLVQIDLNRVWMQCGNESLPAVSHVQSNPERVSIAFHIGAHQPAFQHNGIDVSPGEITFNGCSLTHRRSFTPHTWGAMSLTPTDLASAGQAIAGCELMVPSVTRIVRPSLELMTHLLTLHLGAVHLAKTAPGKLVKPEIARSLEQALIRAMVRCLTDGASSEPRAAVRYHSSIMARLEEFFAANHDRPAYLAEVCTATGASERTLRTCCHEQLGMGPVRYLWLRRMHLARRALMHADPAAATVTEIATRYGFCELGRFSVQYRVLFGELPSVSLHRPAHVRSVTQDRPLGLPVSDFA